MSLDTIDKRIVNDLQGGFPLSPNPWEDLAHQYGLDSTQLIERIQTLQDDGYISRFGPLYHAEKLGGGLTLAAMKVPAGRFDEVADIVNGLPEVAHNYEREHRFNMWFVIATETPEMVNTVISRIEKDTRLKVYNMPKQREFFLGLHFEVT